MKCDLGRPLLINKDRVSVLITLYLYSTTVTQH